MSKTYYLTFMIIWLILLVWNAVALGLDISQHSWWAILSGLLVIWSYRESERFYVDWKRLNVEGTHE